jgi:hypothetical protein
MADHKRRIKKLESDARATGGRRIIVCWCMRDHDKCTCEANQAGDDDVILRVTYEGEKNVRP